MWNSNAWNSSFSSIKRTFFLFIWVRLTCLILSTMFSLWSKQQFRMKPAQTVLREYTIAYFAYSKTSLKINSDGGCENRSNNLHALCIPPTMFFSVKTRFVFPGCFKSQCALFHWFLAAWCAFCRCEFRINIFAYLNVNIQMWQIFSDLKILDEDDLACKTNEA